MAYTHMSMVRFLCCWLMWEKKIATLRIFFFHSWFIWNHLLCGPRTTACVEAKEQLGESALFVCCMGPRGWTQVWAILLAEPYESCSSLFYHVPVSETTSVFTAWTEMWPSVLFSCQFISTSNWRSYTNSRHSPGSPGLWGHRVPSSPLNTSSGKVWNRN